jgi:hypothetical protein
MRKIVRFQVLTAAASTRLHGATSQKIVIIMRKICSEMKCKGTEKGKHTSFSIATGPSIKQSVFRTKRKIYSFSNGSVGNHLLPG